MLGWRSGSSGTPENSNLLNSKSKVTEHKSWTLPTLFLRTPTYPLPLLTKILDSCMTVENNYECMRRTVRLLGTCINITLICENQIRYK